MTGLLQLTERPRAQASPDVRGYLRKSVVCRRERYARALRSCRKKLKEKSVHELRVETRKLLALISLLQTSTPGFSARRAKRRLKRLFRRLAKLRDVHVQLSFLEQEHADQAALKSLTRTLFDRKKRLVKQLRSFLTARRCRRTLRSVRAVERKAGAMLVRADAQSVSRACFAAIDHAFRRIAALRTRPDALDAEMIHRTRVAFKRFRYLLEIMESAVPQLTRKRLEQIQRFQGRMGEIQDIEILQKTIAAFGPEDRCSAIALRHIRTRLKHRRSRLITKYANSSDELLSFWSTGNQLHHVRPSLN